MTHDPNGDSSIEKVYLVGVRLWEGGPIVYALVLYYEEARGDRNRPLTSNGRILFFRSITSADAVLSMGDEAFAKHRPAPSNLSLIYDMPRVLKELAEASALADKHALDFANELLDFAEWSVDRPSDDVRARLAKFCDWATFESDIESYAPKHSTARRQLLDDLHCCIGAVFASSRLIDA